MPSAWEALLHSATKTTDRIVFVTVACCWRVRRGCYCHMYLTAETWPLFTAAIKPKMPALSFNTWIAGLRLIKHDETGLEVGVANRFIRQWLLDRYADLILETAEEVCGERPADLSLSICPDLYKEMRRRQQEILQPQPAMVPQMAAAAVPMAQVAGAGNSARRNDRPAAPAPGTPAPHAAPKPALPARGGRPHQPARPLGWSSSVNRDFRLDNFVLGPANQFAWSVSREVADHPASNYNPLFFYGGSGLGKTHLLHAITQAIREQHPELAVAYVSCEEFTNSFIREVRAGQLEAFRKRYRSLDVLVIDDIHFLSGKDRTEVEFNHTFDELLHLGKQIVLAADAHPREIPGLRGKLVTRLLQGLVVKLAAPCRETRQAIVQSKAQRRGLRLARAVVEHLATQLEGDVREIEGVVMKLGALALAENREPDLRLVDQALDIIRPRRVGPFSLDEICRAVEKHYGVSHNAMLSASREQRIVTPRHVAMYLAKHLTQASYQTIGRYFGKRNHATVIHGVNKITRTMGEDELLRQGIEALRRRLGA